MIRGKALLIDPTKLIPGASAQFLKKRGSKVDTDYNDNDNTTSSTENITNNNQIIDNNKNNNNNNNNDDDEKKVEKVHKRKETLPQDAPKLQHAAKPRVGGRGRKRRKPIRKVFIDPSVKRINVIKEIQGTEQIYFNMLQDFKKQIMPVLKGAHKKFNITADNETLLIEPLLKLQMFHYKFNKSIEGGFIGKVFLEKGDELLALYNQYYMSFIEIIDILALIVKTNNNFRNFLTKLLNRRPAIDPFAIYVAPVQRLTMYELLLKKLLQMTDEKHEDRDNIEKAIELIHNGSVAQSELGRTPEVAALLLQLQLDIKNCPFVLWNSKRRLVRRGILPLGNKKLKAQEECQILLFNDLILVYSNKKCEYRCVLPIIFCEIELIDIMIKEECGIRLLCKAPNNECEVFIMILKDTDVRKDWLKDINETKEAIKKKVVDGDELDDAMNDLVMYAKPPSQCCIIL